MAGGNFGEDMVIGILDTGIWPESESFQDKGMAPVPDRWRGACESGAEFNSSLCNRKLIGARSFSKALKQRGLNISTPDDYDSPRDFYGHGTHTSSTAAGSPVADANYFGYAKGTATGIAPKARLAMYKVLFYNDTYESAASDTLAGIDQAIADGVDLMSLSLGWKLWPHGYTIFNGAPWITTIGAGTIDRDYAADVSLGNGILNIRGKSVYPDDLLISQVPLYFGHGNRSKELCEDNAIDQKDAAGKIVFCDFSESGGIQSDEMERVGAAGAIFSTDSGIFLSPSDFYMPFVAVSPKDGDLVKDYIIKSENPVVDIKFQITVLGAKPAPMVAWFSSRGPSRRAPMILKPDILAPGVDILAAWAPTEELHQ
ncbi:Subtilisin-like protease SBT1.3 [Vitis vinifera]|uniref:Subtilisin-like protease SBT1.3 n=1 Tax=Vitis vinifera TaxID=29760 RepID=A0A438EPW6_VITVI|nr:Subtilisin-like protease SBT1.3 [Vitis vinifera]